MEALEDAAAAAKSLLVNEIYGRGNAALITRVAQRGCSRGNCLQRYFWLEDPDGHWELRWEHKSWLKTEVDSTVPLAQVTRVMPGQNTSAFDQAHRRGSYNRNTRAASTGQRSLSLVYEDGRSLDITLPDEESYTMWLRGLEVLIGEAKGHFESEDQATRYLRAQWKLADMNRDGTLSASEIIRLVSSMNLNHEPNYVKATVKRVQGGGAEGLNFAQFKELMSMLTARDEMRAIWRYVLETESFSDVYEREFAPDPENDEAATSALLPLSKFDRFLQEVQDETLDEAAIAMLTKLGHPMGEDLGFSTFVNYLMRAENDAASPRVNTVYQDMTRSLSHYFVASSHNTYLEGDQLRSHSSVNRYIDDLCRGCRCVELDCWDGDDEPVIYHGHTLTSKILFRDVIAAIDRWAFDASPYPVVLSIENHCSLVQQQMMADIMVETFGEKLAPPLPPGLGPEAQLPSPEELKGKIVIKGKVNKAGSSLSGSGSVSVDEEFEDDDASEEGGEELTEEQKRDIREMRARKAKAQKMKIAPELEAIIFLRGKKFKNFEKSAASDTCADMSSFSEAKTEKLLSKYPEEWIRYNQRQMSRIYPAGARVDSSNYDPFPSWAAGSQIVALNYQTPSVAMHYNAGLFRDNGGCGYVLKPERLLRNDADAYSASEAVRRVLKIQILSAQQLPKPEGEIKGEVIDPYIMLEVRGVDADQFTGRTHTVQDNGFNPVFGETFEVPMTCPELAILYLAVFDKDNTNSDDFIGQIAVRVDALRNGLRRLPCLSNAGTGHRQFAFASIFVKIEIQDG